MVKHIRGFFTDNFPSLHIAGFRVFTHDFKLLFVFKVAEYIQELTVHSVMVGNLAVGCPTFVFDTYYDTIVFGLPHGIGIDIAAEILHGFGDRCPGKSHLHGIWHTFPHIRR